MRYIKREPDWSYTYSKSDLVSNYWFNEMICQEEDSIWRLKLIDNEIHYEDSCEDWLPDTVEESTEAYNDYILEKILLGD